MMLCLRSILSSALHSELEVNVVACNAFLGACPFTRFSWRQRLTLLPGWDALRTRRVGFPKEGSCRVQGSKKNG